MDEGKTLRVELTGSRQFNMCRTGATQVGKQIVRLLTSDDMITIRETLDRSRRRIALVTLAGFAMFAGSLVLAATA